MGRKRSNRPTPRTGAYYWVPFPWKEKVSWRLLTCTDLGSGTEASHRQLWPGVVDRLADVWGWDPTSLRRYLEGCADALPRGRVSRTSEADRFLISYADRPVFFWSCTVIDRFGLEGQFIDYLCKDDLTLDPRDLRRIEGILSLEFDVFFWLI